MIYEPHSWLEYVFILADHPINAERGRYVLSLVFLSFVITTIGAFASLKVIQGLLKTDRQELKSQLHLIGAICLSATIWSMHFVGMLAYDMDMVHTYNIPLTFASMLIAAAVSYSFIAIIRFRKPSILTYILGGISLGLAVSLMHYSGMLAMEMDAKLLYRPDLFGLSILIAFSASVIAMWLVYKLNHVQNTYFLVLSSIVIGVGVCGLHYTGMMASVFLPYANCRFASGQTYYPLAFTVTAISGLIYMGSYMLMSIKLHGRSLGFKHYWRNFTPVLFFITGISIVTLSVVITEGSLKQQTNERFLNLSQEIEHGIIDKYKLYEQSLNGGLGLYEASNYVSREEWEQFIAIQNIGEKLDGINGVGFIKYLEKDEVPAFVERYAAEKNSAFQVYPETQYDNKFVIKYIEPTEPNKDAIGLDIGFEDNRREAAERSIKTGMPALTNKIELVQDNKARAGFLLLIPYFKQSAADAQEKAIYGWIYAPFIGENFLDDLQRLADGEVTFAVYDGDENDSANLIYKHAAFDKEVTSSQLIQTSEIKLAGQTWRIVFKSTPTFVNAVKSYLPLLQALLGLIITTLLSAITYNQNTREETVKKLVTVKTQELQALSESLEETVKERTSELEKANQAKDMFLANMSHELRTPLNSILGLTKMLLDEKDIPEDHILTLQTVYRASSSLLSIVNDVLDISKIEAEMIVLELHPFELKSFISSVVDQLKPLASQKGLLLKDNTQELPETIVASDTLRLSRIILNLGSNATKYTISGEVNVETSLIAHEDDEYINFECKVSDTGVGIPEDKIDHIFEKFTQAEESTERKFGGTGLGLNITKQLIELMGGTIRVQSKPNEGSTFTIEIPLQLSSVEALEAEDNSDEHTLHPAIETHGRKPAQDAYVLVAEDHEFNQIFIMKLLRQFGFNNTTLVIDGTEAVEKHQKSAYDIILMDCHMPKLNGYDATRKIRSLEEKSNDNTHIPIFAMTADAMLGTKETCLEAGMDRYISKPIDSDILKKHLEEFFIIDSTRPDAKIESSPAEQEEKIKTTETVDVLDLSVLLEYTDNNMDDVKELIALFHETSSLDLKTLKDNVTEGENEEWSSIAHRLKGGAAYIGAETLKSLCEYAQNMKIATKKEREEQYLKIENCHKEICDHLKNKKLM